MRKTLLLLAICISSFSCKDITQREYEITYLNGEKETIKLNGITNLKEGCIYTSNSYDAYICGVRSYKLIKE